MTIENNGLLAARRAGDGCLMHNLKKALQVWATAGHTQAEFIDKTGMAQSTVSQLFSGDRSLTVQSFPQVFHAFHRVELEQALTFLMAHMMDQVPDGLEGYVTIKTHPAAGVEEASADYGKDKLEKAKEWLDRNYRHDPALAALLVSAFELSGSEKGKR